ncbi:iron-containing alcohol dehydrogenase family protein [Paenilisteria rocourtiae]|uniref:Putative oxidoreductase n=1 Tax=Listeria rocourtiae TaxID=647910 RepID=A0A4R6ZI40_9LIST|nr:iron-containing alcohol dehydrogenase family protein [Listeria rocourtiae]EUJ47688.1 glycerol dehydrogenase [Listeria rocourtiae FSL F6-920]MBC1604885.1 iron-containing alcohol dehydrogenase family protein [Listeria rocourtiae]TDR51977.1 putative oxidoreductase [Listeria rocourtiae]
MEKSLIVRGAPQEFECRVGAWEALGEHLERRDVKRILVIHGGVSWEKARRFFPELPGVEMIFEQYGGECSFEERDRMVAVAKTANVEAIIAVGGGKVADLAKAVAVCLVVPVVILPTLAATCAAWTPLSVMYDARGEMLQYDIFARSNALVLLDPSVILDSPIELMVAGIGDTLAKWYEADVIISQLAERSVEIDISLYTAKLCRDILLESSAAALAAMRDGELSEAFVKVVETNIMIGGMVGGFGDDYGRTSGAHSIHDALTAVEATHHLLHGNKVAYGVFVQLMMEGRSDEIMRLIPFYRELGLPTCLYDMGLDSLSDMELKQVAERATAVDETIHLMPGVITAATVLRAIKELEVLMTGVRSI